jgi:hypothetical protein
VTGLQTKEEIDAFFRECDEEYERQTKELIGWDWKKKNNNAACNLWISPKGKEFKHHLGFFGENTSAYNQAKHDIVLDNGFIQFRVEIYWKDEERALKRFEMNLGPTDLFFPCIKDGKLYHYSEAVSLAVYNEEFIYELDKWLAIKKILETLDLTKISSDDIIVLLQDDTLTLTNTGLRF